VFWYGDHLFLFMYVHSLMACAYGRLQALRGSSP
jgi:hypothetical protein